MVICINTKSLITKKNSSMQAPNSSVWSRSVDVYVYCSQRQLVTKRRKTTLPTHLKSPEAKVMSDVASSFSVFLVSIRSKGAVEKVNRKPCCPQTLEHWTQQLTSEKRLEEAIIDVKLKLLFVDYQCWFKHIGRLTNKWQKRWFKQFKLSRCLLKFYID